MGSFLLGFGGRFRPGQAADERGGQESNQGGREDGEKDLGGGAGEVGKHQVKDEAHTEDIDDSQQDGKELFHDDRSFLNFISRGGLSNRSLLICLYHTGKIA